MPRSTHPGELAGLATRLESLADEVGDRDQPLSLSLLEATAQLRRHLEEHGHPRREPRRLI